MGLAGGFQKYFVDDVPPGNTQEARLHILDGLRGWAALSVVLFHFFYELFGGLYPVLRADYAHFLTNGPFAVVVFFILSGQALSVSYVQRRDKAALNRMVIKRYPRLAVPVLVSCFLIYILMKCGLVWNPQAAEIVGRQDWLGSFINVEPSFAGMLKDGLFDAFVSFSDYNFFLWTMKYELLGSVLVFVLLYCYRFLVSPVAVSLLLGFVTLAPAPFISCFFFGVTLSLLHANGFLELLRAHKVWQYAGPLLLTSIIAVDALYCPQSDQIDRLHILLAMVFVFIVQTNRFFSAFFTLKFSQFLGKLSFPVYLVHLAVLVSVTSWMIVRLPAAPTMADALLIGGAGVVISYIAAFLFLPVERLTARIGRFLARFSLAFPPFARL